MRKKKIPLFPFFLCFLKKHKNKQPKNGNTLFFALKKMF